MKEKNTIIHIIYIIVIIIILLITCLIFNNKINLLQEEFNRNLEEKNNEIQLQIEKVTNEKQEQYQNKIKNIMQYYNDRLQYGEKLKTNVSMDNDSYFDDLELQVGDIYNSGTNRIVAFCSVLSGETPQIGEIYLIEGFDEDRHAKETAQNSYEVILSDIKENEKSDGSKMLELYFEKIEEKDLKFTPKIRRLK